ncbi:MAG: HD domain-containing protein [Desulfuromonadaceae bacterium]|nr:HD domain-containing protein [Desulfuromonadaceae bacterium]
MTLSLFQPISIACLLPGIFPQVALFTINEGKHVLYIEETRRFTEADRDRLLDNNISTMYVRSGDFKEVSRFAEENLPLILDRNDVDQTSKSEALIQTSSNYLRDIFSDPENSQDAERCKKLTKHLATYITTDQNISRMILAMGGSSPFAIRHSMQVATMSMLAWSKLFPEKSEDLVDIGVAGMLHDIGMSLILSNVVEDIDYWSTPSVDQIKRHPIEGYVFLKKNAQYNDLVLDAVRHHHERYFGGGYPGGLKGDEIKISTQVIGLSDMYCTLITDRPTRKASTPEEAYKIIGDEDNKCFSTLLFTAFRYVIKFDGSQ